VIIILFLLKAISFKVRVETSALTEVSQKKAVNVYNAPSVATES
jgi:hypothetical protein